MILFEAIGAVMNIGWTVISSVKFPGSQMPIAVIMVGAFVAVFGIRILYYVLGMRVDVSDGVETIVRAKKEKTKREKLAKRGK
jgi:hypothetical protein